MIRSRERTSPIWALVTLHIAVSVRCRGGQTILLLSAIDDVYAAEVAIVAMDKFENNNHSSMMRATLHTIQTSTRELAMPSWFLFVYSVALQMPALAWDGQRRFTCITMHGFRQHQLAWFLIYSEPLKHSELLLQRCERTTKAHKMYMLSRVLRL